MLSTCIHAARLAGTDKNLRRALKQSYLMGNFVFAKQGKPGYRRYGKHGSEIHSPGDPVTPGVRSAAEGTRDHSAWPGS
jgi:hypothetical protein